MLLPASVPIPKFASLCCSLVCELRNRRTQPIDLVWLWFRGPHFGLAARMMRTSEPPHWRPRRDHASIIARLTLPVDRLGAWVGERRTSSIAELLAQNPLVEAVAGIEQHLHGDAVIHVNVDGTDRTNLVVIGHRGDRPLLRLEHI